MLRDLHTQETVTTYAFLIAVEVSDQYGPSQETIAMKLADALGFVEGCGKVECDPLGKLETEELPFGRN